jgi:hypothetical protein
VCRKRLQNHTLSALKKCRNVAEYRIVRALEEANQLRECEALIDSLRTKSKPG